MKLLSEFFLIKKYGVTMAQANVASALDISEADVIRFTKLGFLPTPMHCSSKCGNVYATQSIGAWIDTALDDPAYAGPARTSA